MPFATRSWFRLALFIGYLALLASEWGGDLDLDTRAIVFRAQGGNLPATLALWLAALSPSAGGAMLRGYDLALTTAGWVAFGLSLVTCTRPQRPPTGRWLAGLLGLQALLGAALDSDLLYLVAAQLGFLLDFPIATRAWLGLVVLFGVKQVPILLLRATNPLACNIPQVPVPPPSLDLWLNYLGNIALQYFALCIGYFAASELRDRLAMAQAQASLKVSETVLEDMVRQAERSRLVDEMHTTLGGQLDHLIGAIDLAMAVTQGEALHPAATAKALADELAFTGHALVDGAVSTSPVELSRALTTLCAAVPQPHITLQIAPDLPSPAPVQALAILRATQEAVTNAIRHAQASTMQVSLWAEAGAFHLSISDDGIGMGRAQPGNGLTGLGERVRELGGQLTWADGAQGGFNLHIALPLPQTTEKAPA